MSVGGNKEIRFGRHRTGRAVGLQDFFREKFGA
jgi:hypothetical protein